MVYPAAYRRNKSYAHPRVKDGAFKQPDPYKPANDNIPRKPPKPANDNIPRKPPKPANDNFKPPIQRMAGKQLRYGWIRGAGLIGNLGGFQLGSPAEIYWFIAETVAGHNAPPSFRIEGGVVPAAGWYKSWSCSQPGPILGSRCALNINPTCGNIFLSGIPNDACSTNSSKQFVSHADGYPGSQFRYRINEQWVRSSPTPVPAPYYQPEFVYTPLPYGMPGAWKWIDPLSWPVAANDPGPLRIPQSAIRTRGNRNPFRVPAESFVRGYSVPQPSREAETVAAPSFNTGTGQIVVEVTPGGSTTIEPVPNTHAQAKPPQGVKERKVKATRAVLIALDVISKATEAKDMLDCFFTAIPYKDRQAYAKWRIAQQRKRIKQKYPSITDGYLDYLLRQYRVNVGNKRDVHKVDNKNVLLPAYARDNKSVSIGRELNRDLKELDDVSSGSTRSGFTIAEKVHLIRKYWDRIDWMSEDEPQYWDGRELPTWQKFDGMNGVLPCLLANQIDDIVIALPGMSLEQAYKMALDSAGIDPDRITGLENGPQQFDTIIGM